MKHKIEQVCEICVDNNNVAEDSGLVFWDVTLCCCTSSYWCFRGSFTFMFRVKHSNTNVSYIMWSN